MKQREARQPVKVPARLRVAAGWQDATILNLSTRGVMFRCTVPMERGHFLELRRGSHVIVAQIMWASDGSYGAKAQGLIPITDVVQDKPATRSLLLPVDRRIVDRTISERADSARRCARAMEIMLAGFGAICAAFFLADFAFGVLTDPLQQIDFALSVP